MEDLMLKLAEKIRQKDERIQKLEKLNHDYMVCLFESCDQCIELEAKNDALKEEVERLKEELSRIKAIEERNQQRIQKWLERNGEYE